MKTMKLIPFCLGLVGACSTAQPGQISDEKAAQAIRHIYQECLGREPGLESVGDLKLAKLGKSLQVRRRLCKQDGSGMFELGKKRLR